MATSTLNTQSVFADARGTRLRWVIVAILAIVALVSGPLLVVSPALADGGFTVSVGYDGTGQGGPAACAIAGAGGDQTPNDGVVCTNDKVLYLWGFDIPDDEAVTVTMVQTLPDGIVWQPSNVAQCVADASADFTGSGTISPDGRTITCVVNFTAGDSRSGFINMIALVGAGVPDSTPITSTFTFDQGAGVTPLPVPPVIVRSAAQVDLHKSMAIAPGGTRPTETQVDVTVSGGQEAYLNPKGVAAIDSPFTFVDDLSSMPPNTTLLVNNGDCRLNPSGSSPTTSSASGTWFCSQDEPGGPITITVTGADTSGTGTTVDLDGKTVFAGRYRLSVPAAFIPSGGVVAEDQIRGFAPTAAGGSMLNYNGTPEPGGDPTDTCTNPLPNNNCASALLNPFVPTGTYEVLKSINPVGDSGTSVNGDRVLTPGQSFVTKISVINEDPASRPDNLLICEKFDPTKQQITGVPDVTGPVPPFVIEYGVQPLSGPSIQTASCGAPGDSTTDGPWFSSIAAAGGASVVSSVRLVFLQQVPGITFDFNLPMINVDSVPLDQSIDFVGSRHDTKAFGNDRSSSYTVTSSVLSITKLSNGQASTTALREEIVPYTITPTFSQPGGSTPQVLTVVDTLDACYLQPTVSPATLLSWDVLVTPAIPGPDGVVCSPDDVSGAVLTFTSINPLSPNLPVPPIDYTILISPATIDDSEHTNVAEISAPGNSQSTTERRAVQNTDVRGVGLIRIVKFVDEPQVQIAPDQIGFSAQWSNSLSSDAGRTQWIDILPFNGDGRGTSFSGSVALSALEVLGAQTNDVVIEYTSRAPGTVDGDPSAPSNQGGPGDTVWCVGFGGPGCPAVIGDTTAIRITIGNLSGGRQGGVHFTMQPTGNSEGDVYQNFVSTGRAAAFPNPVPNSNQVRVDVVASSVGDTVWWDLNRDGTQGAGEAGIPNITVNLLDSVGAVIGTTTTDANGLYLFEGLRSGDTASRSTPRLCPTKPTSRPPTTSTTARPRPTATVVSSR